MLCDVLGELPCHKPKTLPNSPKTLPKHSKRHLILKFSFELFTTNDLDEDAREKVQQFYTILFWNSR